MPDPTLGPCELADRVGVSGYGVTFRDGRERRAHRVVWEDANGPIPEGLVIRHRCDTKACVRLDHLLIGTQAENMQDAVDRRRLPRGIDSPRGKVTDDEVRDMRRRRAAGEQVKVIALDYDLSSPHVSRITRGLRRGHVD